MLLHKIISTLFLIILYGTTLVLVEHPRSGVLYNFGRFCLYVCLSVCLSVTDDDLRRPSHRKFIFAHPEYLQGKRVKFVYEGHRVKVKVTGAKKAPNAFSRIVSFDRP